NSALVEYDERRGFHGPVTQVDAAGDWATELAKVPGLRDVPEWKLAMVKAVSSEEVDIVLQPSVDAGGKVGEGRETGVIAAKDMKWAFRDAKGERKTTKSPEGVLQPGDVVFVEPL